MKHVAVTDLSAQLPSLLDDVARGEEITLLRDGKPVARLVATRNSLTHEHPTFVPEYSSEEIAVRRAALKRIRENAREIGLKASQDEIKSWIEEGRR